jgi:hypothetical protein
LALALEQLLVDVGMSLQLDSSLIVVFQKYLDSSELLLGYAQREKA